MSNYPYPKFEDLEICPWMAGSTVFIGDWMINLRITKMERKSSLAPSSSQVIDDFEKTFKNYDGNT